MNLSRVSSMSAFYVGNAAEDFIDTWNTRECAHQSNPSDLDSTVNWCWTADVCVVVLTIRANIASNLNLHLACMRHARSRKATACVIQYLSVSISSRRYWIPMSNKYVHRVHARTFKFMEWKRECHRSARGKEGFLERKKKKNCFIADQ